MPAPDSFRDIQYHFTRHLRDPEHEPAPADVEDRRMAIYRRLLFNNVANFIANAFPVLRSLVDDERWQMMMRDYFRNHQATNPLFPQMPTEFLKYLEQERDAQDDPPWMPELAHYEWLETATAIDPREIDMTGIDADGDLLAGVPVLSPLANPVAYTWPVHQLGPDNLPQVAPEQPTYLVVYRNVEDRVGFMELNPVTARLVDLIQSGDGTGQQHIEQIIGEINHPNPEAVMSGGQQALQRLHQCNILLGTRI
ncbi:hypothetical protein J2T55_002642 [Methylohalomonas lacus]|uniref:DUF2063 domain-containing protein n=1 Tax=Methylohalomonas lacus TaxID=398773 RepID=A0AAE3L643_9GAMM|nr:putative DNA-binding domain-containing protein [Methylohalomonas lacus]MCS3904602.1 hypothetical protein [Methylohalomonas lacus]